MQQIAHSVKMHYEAGCLGCFDIKPQHIVAIGLYEKISHRVVGNNSLDIPGPDDFTQWVCFYQSMRGTKQANKKQVTTVRCGSNGSNSVVWRNRTIEVIQLLKTLCRQACRG